MCYVTYLYVQYTIKANPMIIIYAQYIITAIPMIIIPYYVMIRPKILSYGWSDFFFICYHNPRFEAIRSVIPISSIPLFVPVAMLAWLGEVNTAHDQMLSLALKDEAGNIAGQFANEKERLSELYQIHESLRTCIKEVYREGNAHCTNGPNIVQPIVGEIVPAKSREAALILDSPILQEIRNKHNSVIQEIIKLHKEGVYCQESYRENGTIMNRKYMFIGTYKSSIYSWDHYSSPQAWQRWHAR